MFLYGMKKGIVKAISKENRSILVEQEGMEFWYQLADNIVVDYIKKGEAEFNTNEANKITFIKSSFTKSGGAKSASPSFHQANQNQNYWESYANAKEKQLIISRQACLNSALKFYELNKENIKELTLMKVLRTAEVFFEYCVNNVKDVEGLDNESNI